MQKTTKHSHDEAMSFLRADLHLQLYALFKQGTQDPPFEEAKKPGMMDIQVRMRQDS